MSIPIKYCRIDATTRQCNTGIFFHLLTGMLIPNILLKLFEIKECNFQQRYIQLFTEGHKQCLTDVMEFLVLID